MGGERRYGGHRVWETLGVLLLLAMCMTCAPVEAKGMLNPTGLSTGRTAVQPLVERRRVVPALQRHRVEEAPQTRSFRERDTRLNGRSHLRSGRASGYLRKKENKVYPFSPIDMTENSTDRALSTIFKEQNKVMLELRKAWQNITDGTHFFEEALEQMKSSSDHCTWERILLCNDNHAISEAFFSDMGLDDFPMQLTELTTLKILSLDGNDFTIDDVPDLSKSLKDLEALDLDNLGLGRVPLWIGHMTKLIELELENGWLSELPDVLENLKSLEVLQFDHQSFSKIPEVVFKMKSLVHIDADMNNILFIPKEIGNLKNLRVLEATNNEIKSVAMELFALKYIEEVDMSFNHLHEVPEITGSKKLKVLLLNNNMISELPHSFGNLVGLEKLSLENNRIQNLPQTLGNLQGLRELNLSHNRLAQVAFMRTRKLLKFYLNDNRLTELPLGMCEKLVYLEEFSLSHNLLKKLPEDFGEMASLEVLDLGHNMISTLPKSIEKLSQMDVMRINNNRLEELPEEIRGLTNMEVLDIRHNKLKMLPIGLTKLKELIDIPMSFNKLKELPEDFGMIAALRRVAADHNVIRRVPPSVSRLSKVYSVDLSHNELTEFPDSVMKLPHIRDIYVDNNLFSMVPLQIAKLPVLNKFHVANSPNLKSFPRMILASPNIYELAIDYNTLALPSPANLGTSSAGRGNIILQENPLEAKGKNRIFQPFPMYLRDVFYIRQFLMMTSTKPLLPDVAVKPVEAEDASLDCYEVSYINRDLPSLEGRMNNSSIFQHHSSKGYSGSRFRFFAMTQCICARDFYSVESSAFISVQKGSCRPCPTNAVCVNGAVTCANGYYLKRKGHQDMKTIGKASSMNAKQEKIVAINEVDYYECRECVEGAECEKNRLIPKPGYWNSDAVDVDYISTNVYECSNPSACEGGSNNTCALGYEGILCQSCSTGYFNAGQFRCQKCPAWEMSVLMFVATTVGAVLFFVFVFVYAISNQDHHHEKSSKNAITGFMNMAKDNLRNGVVLTKGAVGFAQVVTLMSASYNVKWPYSLDIFDELFGWVNFDILMASNLECVWELSGGVHNSSSSPDAKFTFFHRLIFIIALPFTVTLVAVTFLMGARLTFYTFQLFEAISWTNLRHKTYKFAGLILLLIYVPVSANSLRFFRCRTFDYGEHWWLESDVNSPCYDGEWFMFLPVVVASILCYTVALPVFIFCVTLFWNTSRLNKTHSVIHELVSAPYKHKYRYWESVEIVRKILIGAVIAHLFSSYPSFQIYCAMFASFIFVVLHYVVFPHVNNDINHVNGIFLVLTYLTLSLGVVSTTDGPDGVMFWYSITIVGFNFLALVVVVGLVLWDLLRTLLHLSNRSRMNFMAEREQLTRQRMEDISASSGYKQSQDSSLLPVGTLRRQESSTANPKGSPRTLSDNIT